MGHKRRREGVEQLSWERANCKFHFFHATGYNFLNQTSVREATAHHECTQELGPFSTDRIQLEYSLYYFSLRNTEILKLYKKNEQNTVFVIPCTVELKAFKISVLFWFCSFILYITSVINL